MSRELHNNVYIVTGGSRGFGLAIAKSLVGHGARVGLISRNQSGLDQAVAEIGADHALGVAADVGSRASVSIAFEKIHTHFGRLDGLVNNAGLATPNKVENLVEEEVLLQVQTNFLGTVFCSQLAIPMLKGSENPRIITISSASAWHYDEMSHLSIYASTKAAVERFTRDLRLEVQADGIGVTCIRPGGAWTNFSDGWDTQALEGALAAWKDVGAHMDLGMEVTHVGDAVRYALSQPPGVAIDLMEIRPNALTSKSIF
ncbi:MAG: SDR family NAD(P)-dependent oxidoreductase [Halioglobus sp.]|jgi:NAD(P)-dependent dehydrogenase (short-subunit alcohol dehydrogenase family)|nr:SDR family NAD(P)-dependent oxidoreductase [Halioglobus sp.]